MYVQFVRVPWGKVVPFRLFRNAGLKRTFDSNPSKVVRTLFVAVVREDTGLSRPDLGNNLKVTPSLPGWKWTWSFRFSRQGASLPRHTINDTAAHTHE
jgi:hypothetical protein